MLSTIKDIAKSMERTPDEVRKMVATLKLQPVGKKGFARVFSDESVQKIQEAFDSEPPQELVKWANSKPKKEAWKQYVFNVVIFITLSKTAEVSGGQINASGQVSVSARCEEHARRQVLNDARGKGQWIKSIKLVSVETI